MFHSYVVNKLTKRIDAGRAEHLMDQELLKLSFAALAHARDHDPQPDANSDNQWVWDHYCRQHAKKYGRQFQPDVDPDWAG